MLPKAEAGLNSVEKSRSGELFTEVTSGMADRISWLALTGRAKFHRSNDQALSWAISMLLKSTLWAWLLLFIMIAALSLFTWSEPPCAVLPNGMCA